MEEIIWRVVYWKGRVVRLHDGREINN